MSQVHVRPLTENYQKHVHRRANSRQGIKRKKLWHTVIRHSRYMTQPLKLTRSNLLSYTFFITKSTPKLSRRELIHFCSFVDVFRMAPRRWWWNAPKWRRSEHSVVQHPDLYNNTKGTQAVYNCLRVAREDLSSTKTSLRYSSADEACASRRPISAEDREFGVRTDPR